jgi:RNA polymerase sigma factor (sigma-70 family)
MITAGNRAMQESAANDADLVAASLTGNCQAFVQIVERHQNLICAIAYSATGSLSQSEDLAQETFFTAWSQLRNLREPTKLRSWLCGIARNLASNWLRRSRRETLSVAGPLDRAAEVPARNPTPIEEIISKEEEAILWRSLERVPEAYREPLILFYREHQSIERVAEALQLSGDAVKQRLSRGRKLLQEQVVAVVEGALKRSAPGKAFTLGVIAALPALATSAAAATIGATAATGTTAAKSAAGAGLLGGILGPMIGVLGGYLGAKASIENTKSPRERRFMVKLSWATAGFALLFTAAIGLLTFNAKALLSSHPRLFVGALVCVMMGYLILLCGLVIWSNHRQQQIRRDEAAKVGLPILDLENVSQRHGGFEYRSKTSLLGLPLVHVKFGNAMGQHHPPAFGWIAIGDTAFGVLFAAGGVAVGGIALGGLAVGVLSLAGAAFGAFALGGWAMGFMAAGGGAVAWTAAFGGLAVAHDYAVGGLAIAQHANDEAARGFFSGSGFLLAAKALMENSRWLVLIALWPVVLGWRHLKSSRAKKTGSRLFAAIPGLLLGMGCEQSSAAEKSTAESVTLTNGIRVVALHFPGSTNVAIFTSLPMGLASDGTQQAQWSHLVEHLVIRSTVPADSPIANAETLPDHMRLDFYGHIGNWEEGLKHAADWLRGVPFTEQNLLTEKPKVNSECDFTVRNLATHKFAMAAWSQGYRHDQEHAAIRGDIAKATITEIQKYRDERLVVLSNTLVCVVGGIEPAKALEAFAAKLSGIRSEGQPVAPVKVRPGSREMTWDLDARHLVLTWPIPAIDHDDFPPLLVAAQWLNMQFFADQELKKLTGMVFAGADLTTPESNYFFVSASLRSDASFDAVYEKVEGHLQQLTSGKGNLSLIPMIGKQFAASLTTLPDPAGMKGQLPADMTPAMLEMNIGLQWGLNEFRYGAQKSSLAKRLETIDGTRLAKAARVRLVTKNMSAIRLSHNP